MNLKMMNESFKRKYSDILNESVNDSDKEQLRKALVLRSMNVVANGGNIKQLEIALQDVIENFYPDHCWWEVTDCQIFNELFMNGVNPREICDMIVDQLKPEFAGASKVDADDDCDESFLTEDPGNESYRGYFFKPFDKDSSAVVSFKNMSANTLKNKVAEGKKAGFDLAEVETFRGNKVAVTEFDPELDPQAVKIAFTPAFRYCDLFLHMDRLQADLTKNLHRTYQSKNRRAMTIASVNPVAIRAAANAIIAEGKAENLEVIGYSGKPMQLDELNKLANIILKSKYKDVAVDQTNKILTKYGLKTDNKYITSDLTDLSTPNAAANKPDQKSSALNVFNDRGVVSDRPLNAGLIRKLQDCLNRLNESTMSDEDKRDSDIIRGIIDKTQARRNAKLSPEEQSVMTKYGINRDTWSKELSVDGRSLHPSYDGKTAKTYKDYHDWNGTLHRNGDPSKINYADRARKLPQRADSQVAGRWSSNGAINAHTRNGDSTLMDVERDVIADRDRAPVKDMERHLWDRKYYQGRIDRAQGDYDSAMNKARAQYDKEVKWASDQYRRDTVDASASRQRAQDRIDQMLKRK